MHKVACCLRPHIRKCTSTEEEGLFFEEEVRRAPQAAGEVLWPRSKIESKL